jgi:nitrogen regulatory protein P-II 1
MKLITAIMRPEKLDELIDVVVDSGAHGLTVTEVRGFGQQFGQLVAGRGYADPAGAGRAADRKAADRRAADRRAADRRAADRRAALLPKIRLEVLVLDDDAETVVEAIAKHARTETVGDGKIWVTPVDGALRVRTGERNRDAV